MNADWFILQTEPQREITAVAGIIGRGVHAYGPTLYRKVIHKGKKIEEQRAMFPGYIFVKVRTDYDFQVPKRVRGVRGYLRDAEERPYVLPAVIVDEIVAREQHEFDRFRSKKGMFKFEVGQEVRATDGPFWGFVGRVEALDDKGRVDALLDLFGRKTKVRFEGAQLERA